MKRLTELISKVPRNFRGGFFCAFFGMLIFWAMYPYSELVAYVALIIGAFTATIIGFWFEDVMKLTKESWLGIKSSPTKIKASRHHVGVLFQKISGGLVSIAQTMVNFFVSNFKKIIGIPVWFQEDLWRKTVLVLLSAIATYLLLNVILVWQLYSNYGTYMLEAQLGFLYIIAPAFILIISIFVTLNKFSAGEKSGSQLRRRQAFRNQLRERGAWRFYFRKIKEIFMAHVIFMGIIVIFFASTALFTSLPFAFVFLPSILAILLLRGLVMLATRPNHWPSYVVGLSTVFVSIWLLKPQFADFRMVVLIAIGTGFASGILSYGLSVVTKRFFVALPKLRSFIFKPLFERFAWIDNISERSNETIKSWIPKKIFSY